jgi:hypothetical protein
MPAKHFINWTIPDPKHMEPEEFNKVGRAHADEPLLLYITLSGGSMDRSVAICPPLCSPF